MNEVKQYAERDLMAMDFAGDHYCRHISAMTREKLNSKSDIAAELGWRDMQIANLQQQLTATTNSLTNTQEVLKSAGIEADTVQAGVMELVRKLAELEQKKILLEQGCENSPLLHEMLDWKERAEAAELKLADHNALRADGVQIAINNLKALDASPFAIHSLECKLYELRAGNAGKGGSHE